MSIELGLIRDVVDLAKLYQSHRDREEKIRVTPIPIMCDNGHGEPSDRPTYLLCGVYVQNRQLIREPIRNVGYMVGKERCWFGSRVLVGPNHFSLPLPVVVEPHSAQMFYADGGNTELNRCVSKLKAHLDSGLWSPSVRVAVRTEIGDIYESKKFSRDQVEALRKGLLENGAEAAPYQIRNADIKRQAVKVYVTLNHIHVDDLLKEPNVKVALDSNPVGKYTSRQDAEDDCLYLNNNQRWQRPLTLTGRNGEPLKHSGFQVEELESNKFAIVCSVQPI